MCMVRVRAPWETGVVAAAAAVLAAGGAGAVVFLGTRDGAPPVTLKAYAAQVREVCARYGAQLDRIPPPDISAAGTVIESISLALPVLHAEAREIAALRRPPALAAELETFFALSARARMELEAALVEANRRELFPMAQALMRFEDARSEAQAIASRVGFAC